MNSKYFYFVNTEESRKEYRDLISAIYFAQQNHSNVCRKSNLECVYYYSHYQKMLEEDRIKTEYYARQNNITI